MYIKFTLPNKEEKNKVALDYYEASQRYYGTNKYRKRSIKHLMNEKYSLWLDLKDINYEATLDNLSFIDEHAENSIFVGVYDITNKLIAHTTIRLPLFPEDVYATITPIFVTDKRDFFSFKELSGNDVLKSLYDTIISTIERHINTNYPFVNSIFLYNEPNESLIESLDEQGYEINSEVIKNKLNCYKKLLKERTLVLSKKEKEER